MHLIDFGDKGLGCSKDKAEKINTIHLFENTFNRFIKTQKTRKNEKKNPSQIRCFWFDVV